MPTLQINRPDTIAVRRVTHCPTCEQDRRFSGEAAFWYSPIWTCLGCGDAWGDGERMERPFKPRWRQENRRRAAETWDRAVSLSSPEYREWLNEQMAAATREDTDHATR
ncbi:MAG: hypothetical protein JWO67_2042 [Streptosporangiaceae bacterium]|nr:hypothetical protein [Streptosporangiaceae bacterium]